MSATAGQTRPGSEQSTTSPAKPGASRFDESASPPWWLPLALLILSWPVWRLGMGVGIDASWNTALALAHEDDLRFGREIAYSYGPLGYLVYPAVLSLGSLIGAITYAALGGACLAFAAAFVCFRRFGARAGIAAAAGVTLVAPMEIFAPEIYSLALVVLACLVAQREIPVSLPAFAAAAGASAGIQALVKPSAGAIALIALVIVVATAAPRVPSLIAGAAGYVGGVLVGWLLIGGQQVGDFLTWATFTVDISAGYTEAMLFEDRGRAFEYLAMTLLIAWAAAYAFRNVLPIPGRGSTALRLLLLGVVLWIVLKEAFVRHDVHSAIAFWSIGLIGLAIMPRVEKRLMLAVLLGASILMTSTATLAPLSAAIDPTGSVKSFLSAVTALARSGERARINAQAAGDARGYYLVPQDMLRRIGSSGVHVDPTEVSAVTAYGLRWQPVPVFQRFAAYTERADGENAEIVGSPEGPQVVLREKSLGLDGRNDLWDSPRYMLALACTFSEWKATSRWQLLERRAKGCSPPRALATLSVPPGAPVTVPTPSSDDSLVTATVTRDLSLADRIRAFVFKPGAPFTVWADGTPYRVAQVPSSGPMIVRMPPNLWSPDFGGAVAHRTLMTSSAAHYVFQEIAVSRPAE